PIIAPQTMIHFVGSWPLATPLRQLWTVFGRCGRKGSPITKLPAYFATQRESWTWAAKLTPLLKCTAGHYGRRFHVQVQLRSWIASCRRFSWGNPREI